MAIDKRNEPKPEEAIAPGTGDAMPPAEEGSEGEPWPPGGQSSQSRDARSMGAGAMASAGAIGGGAVKLTHDVLRGAIEATEDVGSGLVGGVTHLATDIVHGVRDVGNEARDGASDLISAVGDVGGTAVQTVVGLLTELVDGVRHVVVTAIGPSGNGYARNHELDFDDEDYDEEKAATNMPGSPKRTDTGSSVNP